MQPVRKHLNTFLQVLLTHQLDTIIYVVKCSFEDQMKNALTSTYFSRDELSLLNSEAVNNVT